MGPIFNFIQRYGKFAFLILILISLYRIADIVMGVMANIFYLEKGYKISDIATYSKFFGVFATIFGGFVGGYCSYKFGTMKCLFFGALIAALSNLLFAWLAVSPISINFLIAVITADNISSGFAGAAFVIYLSGLTSIKFTATQYALFSSIMLFLPKLIAGYAGSWVDIMGYPYFFSLTALLGLPVLILIIWISKVAPVKNWMRYNFLNTSISNLYTKPSSKAEVSSQIIYGEKFKILSKKKSWVKIKTSYDNYVGFIKNNNFKKKFNPTK